MSANTPRRSERNKAGADAASGSDDPEPDLAAETGNDEPVEKLRREVGDLLRATRDAKVASAKAAKLAADQRRDDLVAHRAERAAEAKLAAAAKPGLTTQLQAEGRQAESQALLDDLAALFTN